MIKSILSSDPFGDKRVTTYSWGSIAIFLDEDPLPMFCDDARVDYFLSVLLWGPAVMSKTVSKDSSKDLCTADTPGTTVPPW